MELIFVVIGQISFQSVADLEAKVAHLRAENDRLRRALGDVCGQIVCGQLMGKLPDNFLEQFSQLPDGPLEQVLRFLPARQVAQMRLVSRKFNHLIRKCSKTMPKMVNYDIDIVVFWSNQAGGLTLDWFDDCNKKITTTTTTTLEGDEVALSELLRFIHIDARMFFSDGGTAADKVLDQLSKAWLKILPDMVIFTGDLSQTSPDSLRAFLVKVEPTIERLHFQQALNIPRNLLSDDVICAAGRLNGLMVLPRSWGEELADNNVISDINIGDNTLLSMVDANDISSYFLVMGCSSITPGGIRAFVEKWMKKKRRQADANYSGIRGPLEFCQLTFYKCANVTPATIEEACGDLLKKGTTAESVSCFGGSTEIERVRYTIQCPSSNCSLGIVFHYTPFRCYCIHEPIPDDEIDNNYDDHYHDYYDGEIDGEAIDYDDV
uniref:F-box domain-containing protein n=1 Tax=Plectus sambesii TaxID=2011161 RepID=A0A914XFZ0_9BILA